MILYFSYTVILNLSLHSVRQRRFYVDSFNRIQGAFKARPHRRRATFFSFLFFFFKEYRYSNKQGTFTKRTKPTFLSSTNTPNFIVATVRGDISILVCSQLCRSLQKDCTDSHRKKIHVLDPQFPFHKKKHSY